MKKLFITIIIVSLFTILLTACNGQEIEFEFPDYNVTNEVNENKLDIDENVSIDGSLDETFWADALENNSYTIVSKVSEDIKLTVRTHITNKGVYFGLNVYETALYYNKERSAAKNTSAEVYFTAFGKEKSDMYNIRLVPTGNESEISSKNVVWKYNEKRNGWYVWMLDWAGAAKINGQMNTTSDENIGYDCEAFIPWESIGCEPQEYIQYTVAFNHVESQYEANSERTWTGTPGVNLNRPSTWYVASNEETLSYYDMRDKTIKTNANFTIDGNLDEEEWSNITPFSYSYSIRQDLTVGLSYKSVFTDEGLYLGFEVADPYIYYSSAREIGANSALEIYVAPYGTDKIDENCYQIRLTSANIVQRRVGAPGLDYPWLEEYFSLQTATSIQGTLNSTDVSENTGYTAEIFYPWEIFGLESKPENMLIYPTMHHIESETADKKDPSYKYISVKNLVLNKSVINLTENFIILDESGLSAENCEFKPQDIYISQSDLNGDYYEKTVAFVSDLKNISKGFICDATNIIPKLELPNGVTYIENQDKTITFKIHKDDITNLSNSKYKVIVAGEEYISSIIYLPVSIDGELDEIYGNTYSISNSENNVNVDTNVYLGEEGIYLYFDVIDPILNDTSRIETFIYVNEFGFDTTWHFRFYPNSSSYTYRIFEYTTPDSNSWAWKELTGDNMPSMNYYKTLTDGGYIIETYISYESLGLEEKPDSINMITGCGLFNSNKNKVIVYVGDVQSGNTYYLDTNNYIKYDENGYCESN